MKNSPLSALVLFGVAGLVGGVAYLASGDERIESTPDVVSRPVVKTPKVMTVTPHERKLKRRLEEAEQQLEEYKRTGKVLENGTIKTDDGTGTPLYVHPELIEGKGRYGEPLYMMATFKRKAAVPLLRKMKAPKAENIGKMVKLPKGQTPLTMGGKRPTPQQSLDAPDDGSAGGDDGAKNGGSKAPGKPGDASKPADG